KACELFLVGAQQTEMPVAVMAPVTGETPPALGSNGRAWRARGKFLLGCRGLGEEVHAPEAGRPYRRQLYDSENRAREAADDESRASYLRLAQGGVIWPKATNL